MRVLKTCIYVSMFCQHNLTQYCDMGITLWESTARFAKCSECAKICKTVGTALKSHNNSGSLQLGSRFVVLASFGDIAQVMACSWKEFVFFILT